MNKPVFTIFLLALVTCFNLTVRAQTTDVEAVFSERFENPVGMEYSHGGSRLMYIVRKDGYVDVKDLDNSDEPSINFIDISERVTGHFGELGLLGLAFSPDFLEDGRFYLYYTYKEDGNFYSTLARYSVSDGVGDPDSEERLFELYQPQDNHNGGQLTFGPDGYLYVAVGDGGRDSRELAQNTQVLNGSILRIDVSPETGYDIPSDNPFVGNPAGLDEIYAWGFRNPWRISFDSETGNLWVADVGQKDRETIYIVDKGENYGWPIIEGSVCFPIDSECDKTGLEMPVYEYQYGDAGRSITGGYVYRGEQHPSLVGKYIYGDFITRKILALEIDHDTREVISNREIATSEQNLPTFGVDSGGEIYIGGWASGVNSGIFRLVPEVILSTLSLNTLEGNQAIRLNWDVSRSSGIELFNIYRGSEPGNLSLYTTVLPDIQEYVETEIPEEITFYAVSVVNQDGVEGDLSNRVSYVNSEVEISEKWSLISLPFETEGVTLSNSVAYSFDGSYQEVDQLESGIGYWTRSYESEIFRAKGAGIQENTVSLDEGWNIIGGLAGDLPVEFIEDIDGIMNSTPVFELKNSVYIEAVALTPYKGYWIYATENGKISLDMDNIESSQASVNSFKAAVSESQEPESLDKILFSSEGQSLDLKISNSALDPELMNRFRVPPVAPNASLDVRTPDGFVFSDKDLFEIDLTSSSYPVRVQFEKGASNGDNVSASHSYKLILEVNGSKEEIVLDNGDFTLVQKEYDSIFLERVQSENADEIVRDTKLLPSYPNPFNPATNIPYRIAEQLNVEISVYDAAGRRIAVLVNEEQRAGQYAVSFDASNLASGVYFVRFKAGGIVETQKLTLIK